ncbi:MAG: hypothetical protein RSA65_05800 [Clostridia bacterium]
MINRFLIFDILFQCGSAGDFTAASVVAWRSAFTGAPKGCEAFVNGSRKKKIASFLWRAGFPTAAVGAKAD